MNVSRARAPVILIQNVKIPSEVSNASARMDMLIMAYAHV